MKYLLLLFCLLLSNACKEEIIIESATSEMYFEDLVGTWDVDWQSTKFVNSIVDRESGVSRYVITISDDHKISIRFSTSQSEMIKDIFVGEQLDQIMIIGPPDSFMIGEYTTSNIDFFDVLTNEGPFQIWKATRNFEDVNGENIKIVTQWTMNKR